jgi:hypothetical protein
MGGALTLLPDLEPPRFAIGAGWHPPS